MYNNNQSYFARDQSVFYISLYNIRNIKSFMFNNAVNPLFYTIVLNFCAEK